MDHADIISMLDKKYNSTDRVLCPNQGKSVTSKATGKATEDHGHLAVHGSGSALVCGICGYQQPIARVG